MTPKSFDHDDLGIDLDRVAALPECQACRKKTDGAVRCPDGTILCGTHFDEFAAMLFPKHSRFAEHLSPAAFAKELREGRYRACWDAKLLDMDR